MQGQQKLTKDTLIIPFSTLSGPVALQKQKAFFWICTHKRKLTTLTPTRKIMAGAVTLLKLQNSNFTNSIIVIEMLMSPMLLLLVCQSPN